MSDLSEIGEPGEIIIGEDIPCTPGRIQVDITCRDEDCPNNGYIIRRDADPDTETTFVCGPCENVITDVTPVE